MERKNKIQELKGFTLNRKYGARSHRTPRARLLLWEQEQSVPFPLHPALSAPFACSPSSSSSEAPLTQVRELNPLHRNTQANMFYHATRWGSEMTWGNWQEQARAVHLASPLTSTLIHLFQGRHPPSHALHSLSSDLLSEPNLFCS